ncbi:MAG: hypothetical protein ACW963_04810 [Candidatus Sifarchaeia archaeon]|jgi:hypothetical protein
MKKAKKLVNVILGLFLFVLLIGSAFAISPLFGLFFVLGFLISVYKGDLKRKPLKPIAIFIGALITRFALGRLTTTFPNYELTLDFGVAILAILFIFLLGWKIKKS